MKLSSPLHNLSISLKGLLLIAVPLIAQFVFVTGIVLILWANHRAQNRSRQNLVAISEAQGVLSSLALAEATWSDYLVRGEPSLKTQHAENVAEATVALSRLQRTVGTETDQAARVDRLVPIVDSFLSNQASGTAEAGRVDASPTAAQAGTRQFGVIHAKLQEILDSAAALDRACESQLAQNTLWMNGWLLFGAIGSIATAAGGAATFNLAIGRRMRRLVTATVRMAKGEPPTPAQAGRDEFATVDLAFHQVARDLADTRDACESQTRILQSVLASMGDAVIVAGKDCEILLMNPAALRLFETGAALDRNKYSATDVDSESERATAFPRSLLARVLAGESIDEFDVLLPQTNVRPATWVTVTGRLLHDAQGRSCGAVLVARDISNRKSNEHAIRIAKAELETRVEERTRALAAVNRELAHRSEENEAFVHTVSHDLRSPLVNLLGFSKELDLICEEVRTSIKECPLPVDTKARLETLLNEDTPEALRYIYTAVERMSSIIDALLRLARAGRVAYRSIEVDLNVTVHRVIAGLSITVHQRGASLTCQELPSVIGDPTALEQVFANLIGNSLNYLDPQRKCEIEIGYLPVDDSSGDCESEQHVTLYVKDNGLGIPRQSYDQVFRVFQRIHPRAASGEGVGLALLKRIIDRHSGRIWFESTEGEGTTFFVELPLAHKASLQPAFAM